MKKYKLNSSVDFDNIGAQLVTDSPGWFTEEMISALGTLDKPSDYPCMWIFDVSTSGIASEYVYLTDFDTDYADIVPEDNKLASHLSKSRRSAWLLKTISPIQRAMHYATAFGQIDGAHHKAWVIDQMVRALKNSPILETEHKDVNNIPYTYTEQGASDAYTKFVNEYQYMNDAGVMEREKIYSWDEGIAP